MDNRNLGFNQFSINRPQYGTKDFLQSNSLVAKIAYLLMVILIFIIVLRLGLDLLEWWFDKNKSPHLFNGMIAGNQMVIFNQDPNMNNSKTIFRSDNEREGLEFSWSCWIFIQDLQYLAGTYRHIFHKGNADILPNGMISPNNAPGLYISPNKNELTVVMSTFEEVNEQIIIPDIPLNKWLNIAIICRDTTLDIYVNGVIAQSVKLSGVPKQNYGDVYACMNGGFSGYLSNLWYYNYAITSSELLSSVRKGPNTRYAGLNASTDKMKQNYLSMRWYFDGTTDQFNT
jgi:hypothetical protein